MISPISYISIVVLVTVSGVIIVGTVVVNVVLNGVEINEMCFLSHTF